MTKYTLGRYQDEQGNVPYTEWIKGLRDLKTRTRISMRLNRVIEGNFGDHKFERNGVWAIRLDHGPGIRLYYAVEQKEVMILLMGGDKKTRTLTSHWPLNTGKITVQGETDEKIR